MAARHRVKLRPSFNEHPIKKLIAHTRIVQAAFSLTGMPQFEYIGVRPKPRPGVNSQHKIMGPEALIQHRTIERLHLNRHPDICPLPSHLLRNRQTQRVAVGQQRQHERLTTAHARFPVTCLVAQAVEEQRCCGRVSGIPRNGRVSLRGQPSWYDGRIETDGQTRQDPFNQRVFVEAIGQGLPHFQGVQGGVAHVEREHRIGIQGHRYPSEGSRQIDLVELTRGRHPQSMRLVAGEQGESRLGSVDKTQVQLLDKGRTIEIIRIGFEERMVGGQLDQPVGPRPHGLTRKKGIGPRFDGDPGE